MKRETKVRIICGLTALGLAVGYAVFSPKNARIKIDTVRDLVAKVASEYYGDDVVVNDRFVNAYVKTISDAFEENESHISKEYTPDTILGGSNDIFELTEWIPTLEEVEVNVAKVNELH